MSASAQTTQISDNVNQGYIAGRDLYLGDQYVVQETLFFEPDLANVEPPAWTSTQKATELARALAANRLIVLAGQDMDDKTTVARHLAWLLRRELPGTVRVREWYRSSDPQKIETAFHESDTTILLLPQVQPHHIGHRLNELTRVLDLRRNYAVITTDGARADWGIRTGSDDERLWQEISWESYYGRPFLADTLLAELALLNGTRPDWLPRNLQPGSPFAEGLTVEEVAARLKQPERIRRFAQWIQSETASPQALLAKLDQLGGDRTATQEWYQQLAPSDQIFALGLVLFDGLPDDQIFAAVEYLVDSAWRRTDPNLPLFDYRDLARLGANFHLVESGEDGTRIETASRRKREAILQTAWELQRRRLLAVVPAMTRLVKRLSPTTASLPEPAPVQRLGLAYWRNRLTRIGAASGQTLNILKVALRLRFFTLLSAKRLAVADRPATAPSPEPAQDSADEWRFTQGPERELFSSLRRIEQLQRSVVESLSQIGLLSFEAVEASFLELGAEGSIGVQTVVAKALAAWRGKGHHEKLFQVLRAWWQAGSRSTPPKALAQRSGKGTQPLAGIRSTVALAVGYALQYDPPNQMAPELQSLLQDVVEDRHPALRQRVLELTLPLATASHPQQLESFLRGRLIRDQEQMYAIAFGISMAFTLHPFRAIRILDSWQIMVRSQGESEPGDRTIAPRDRLLSTVAMAYGYIRCDPSQTLLSTEMVVAVLRFILDTETHPFVRTHALMAAGLQGLHDFELVAPLLMERLSEIALPDRKNVVSVFVRAYLKQREQLRGGDGEVEHDGRIYPVWLLSPRPSTPIETALYSWLRSGDHPVARQVAAQTFAAFTSTELEQQERALGADQKQIPAAAPSVAAGRAAANPRRLRRLPVLGHAAACLALPLQRRTRALVRPVLAEMLDVERSRPRGALPLLDRWRSSDDQQVQRLARSASGAFRLYRWRWSIILAQVLCIILALAWWEWHWSHQAPLPDDEVLTLQHRRNLPLRYALTRGAAVLRPEPKPVVTPTTRKARHPPGPPSGPPERLLWTSIASLEKRLEAPEPELPIDRIPTSDDLAEWQRQTLTRLFAQLLLDYLRHPEEFETAQQRQEWALVTIDRHFRAARSRTSNRPSEPQSFLIEQMDAFNESQKLQETQALQKHQKLLGLQETSESTPPPPLPLPGAPLQPTPLQLDPGVQGDPIGFEIPSLLEKIRKSVPHDKKPPQEGGDHDER